MMASSPSLPWVRGRAIGRGSYGSVSLGFDRGSGRIFAVKSVDLNSHSDQIDSLENEIRILSSLDYSPYIVEYLGDDYDGSHRNLHLELLPGGTVTDAAARRRHAKFSDEDTVRSHTRCLVSALRHVHSRGIVHCDVKGRNVIVGQDPNTAKLADFGSAIRAGSGNRPRGSPLWMAPEVIRGEYQGPESDVWAIGCTVIEMVTGRPAWEDKGAETLSRIGLSDELPELPAGMSVQGWDFLEKCLRRDPKERWSCDQLIQHPFVASETGNDSSPRSVLDRVNSEFDGGLESEPDDDGGDLKTEMESSAGAEPESCMTSRLGELCDGGGGGAANWESEDGWVEVRESPGQSITARDTCCWARGREYADLEREARGTLTGTCSEYCGTSGAEVENDRWSPGYFKKGSDLGGRRERVEGKCERDGTGTGEEAAAAWVLGLGIYSYSLCVDLLLFLPCIMLAMCRCNNTTIKNR